MRTQELQFWRHSQRPKAAALVPVAQAVHAQGRFGKIAYALSSDGIDKQAAALWPQWHDAQHKAVHAAVDAPHKKASIRAYASSRTSALAARKTYNAIVAGRDWSLEKHARPAWHSVGRTSQVAWVAVRQAAHTCSAKALPSPSESTGILLKRGVLAPGDFVCDAISVPWTYIAVVSGCGAAALGAAAGCGISSGMLLVIDDNVAQQLLRVLSWSMGAEEGIASVRQWLRGRPDARPMSVPTALLLPDDQARQGLAEAGTPMCRLLGIDPALAQPQSTSGTDPAAAAPAP